VTAFVHFFMRVSGIGFLVPETRQHLWHCVFYSPFLLYTTFIHSPRNPFGTKMCGLMV